MAQEPSGGRDMGAMGATQFEPLYMEHELSGGRLTRNTQVAPWYIEQVPSGGKSALVELPLSGGFEFTGRWAHCIVKSCRTKPMIQRPFFITKLLPLGDGHASAYLADCIARGTCRVPARRKSSGRRIQHARVNRALHTKQTLRIILVTADSTLHLFCQSVPTIR